MAIRGILFARYLEKNKPMQNHFILKLNVEIKETTVIFQLFLLVV